MIREVVLLPEMLEAGIEALEEWKSDSPEKLVVHIYLAMRGIEEVAFMREANETRH